MNRIPHSKPPHDVLYEYRKQFQVPLNFEECGADSLRPPTEKPLNILNIKGGLCLVFASCGTPMTPFWMLMNSFHSGFQGMCPQKRAWHSSCDQTPFGNAWRDADLALPIPLLWDQITSSLPTIRAEAAARENIRKPRT
jgi:hypothetical protein